MKWIKTEHSERLNIAGGFIIASVQWDILYGKGHKASVNGHELGIFQDVDIAKSEVEKYIREKLRIAMKESE